jgi:hypothetical protein
MSAPTRALGAVGAKSVSTDSCLASAASLAARRMEAMDCGPEVAACRWVEGSVGRVSKCRQECRTVGKCV